MSDSDKALVRGIYDEVFSEGALDVIDEVVSPDAIDHAPPPFPVDDVREGLKQFTRLLRDAFPDLRVAVNDMVAEGDKVAVYYTVQGTYQGELMGIPASGNRVSVEGFDLIRVTDGICTEHWGVFDNGSLMEQMGAGPPS